jgi:hypothetical protein
MPTTTQTTPPDLYAESAHSSNVRWFVCFLLFLATTINYMDRSVFSFIEPQLHNVVFMGWNFAADKFHQPALPASSWVSAKRATSPPPSRPPASGSPRANVRRRLAFSTRAPM